MTYSGKQQSLCLELFGCKAGVCRITYNQHWKKCPLIIILHVGMNNKPTKKNPNQIADNILNLAIKLKRNCDISIPEQNDRYQRKAADVSRKLKENCRKKHLQFFNLGNPVTVSHLSTSKFYLKKNMYTSFIY